MLIGRLHQSITPSQLWRLQAHSVLHFLTRNLHLYFGSVHDDRDIFQGYKRQVTGSWQCCCDGSVRVTAGGAGNVCHDGGMAQMSVADVILGVLWYSELNNFWRHHPIEQNLWPSLRPPQLRNGRGTSPYVLREIFGFYLFLNDQRFLLLWILALGMDGGNILLLVLLLTWLSIRFWCCLCLELRGN